MGNQPNNSNINVEGDNNEENPNVVEVNPEDVPHQAAIANMAQAGVQGGQLSSIPIFSGNKGLEALTYYSLTIGYRL